MPAPPPDTEGLHAIRNTTAPGRLADVVFVHGLGGGAFNTWLNTETKFSWPHELAKDLPRCGVWTFGYAAGITEFGNPGMVIGERGLNLASQLSLAGVGAVSPVLFVTHSMGGLVVKALIDGCRHNVQPPLENLVRRIAGIAFCGTPHFGSGFASAAACLSRYFGWAAQKHLKEMARNEKGIELLNGRFFGWLRTHPLKLHCFAESCGLWRRSRRWGRVLQLGSVVPSQSAILHSHPHTLVDADHLELVKPADGRSHIYRGVLDFLFTALPDVRPAAPYRITWQHP